MGSVASTGLVDKSSTITLGGTAQDAVAANVGRRFLFISNPDAAEDLWVNLIGTALANAAGSFKLAAGASVFFDNVVATAKVSLVAATTGHKFTAYEGS